MMRRATRIMFLALVMVVACLSTAFAGQRVDKIGITTKNLDVYANPSTEAQVIGDLPKGVYVQLVDCEEDWYQIKFGKVKAYISAWHVKDEKIETNARILAEFTTQYEPYQYNRAFNIRKSAKNFDGLVIKPGETISFNELNGEATLANGYREANVQIDGRVVMGEGGGICQVSTTLYNAVEMAGLKILERHTHEIPVKYVRKGCDATVAYGLLDFVFQNTLEYPVRIVTWAGYDAITVTVLAE